MPQIFRIGAYVIYFWANESDPLDPVHVHVVKGTPTANTTKIWITKSGKCLLCNNNSRIPKKTLNDIMAIVEARNTDITNKWYSFFGRISYYC